MKLKQFENVKKEELSLIEVAHAILEEKGDVLSFSDLVNEMVTYLETTPEKIKKDLPQFYTDMNIDGSFISLGDNRWGLRAWYPIDSIDEEVTHSVEEEEEAPRRKKRSKKVTPFADGLAEEDVIDYNDDDPEDEVLTVDEEGVVLADDDEEEEVEDIKAYNADLSALGADTDDEEEIPEGIEEALTIVDDEDAFDDDFEDEDEEDNEEI